MSARRRRAALSALGAVVVALLCAVLASSVEGETHRTVLVILSVLWLVIAGVCVASVLRTEAAVPQAAGPPEDTDEPA